MSGIIMRGEQPQARVQLRELYPTPSGTGNTSAPVNGLSVASSEAETREGQCMWCGQRYSDMSSVDTCTFCESTNPFGRGVAATRS